VMNPSGCVCGSSLERSMTMSRPEFDIIIGSDGTVTLEVKGVKGPRCLDYADLVREIVGHEEQRKLTVEYYAQDAKVRIDAQAEQHRCE
jgi:hypothetical protein